MVDLMKIARRELKYRRFHSCVLILRVGCSIAWPKARSLMMMWREIDK